MYQSISIAEAARQKQTSRQTIYNNRTKFDWIWESLGQGRIIPNKKFQDWQPKLIGGRLEMLDSKEIERLGK